jgi:transcription termination factor NusB
MDVTVDFINSHFADDLQSLENAKALYDEVHAKYEADRLRLEQQLQFITTEAPRLIEKAKEEAAAVETVVKKFDSDEEQLADDVCNHLADVQPLVTKLSSLTGQIKELEKYSQYLQCLAHVEDLSSDIQSALLINAVSRAIDQFVGLVDLAQIILDSKCHHLVDYVRQTVIFWYKILLDKLSSEFDEILRAWQWPFITATLKPSTVPKAGELREQLGTVFHHLISLQLPESLLLAEKIACPFLVPLPAGVPPFLLPIQLLLKPFQKRFAYHFCSSEKTNRIDKPEWYFTQTLTWIRDHQEYLKTRIQPELEKADFGHTSALVEFMRGLVALVVNKMTTDMPNILASDIVFAHLVDETLAFHNELRAVYGYPDPLPSCLHVLIQSDPFRMWMSIEKKSALEKMDAMLSSPTRWSCQYKDIGDVDDCKVSECGEGFMVLLSTITDRYRSLPSTWHQLQFVQLQLELLDDFRVRLVQVRNELQATTECSALSQQFCSILNTVSYVEGVLQQWTNLPFFVKLQFYKHQLAEQQLNNSSSRCSDVFVDAVTEPGCSSPLMETAANETAETAGRMSPSLFPELTASTVTFNVTESSLSKLDVSLF